MKTFLIILMSMLVGALLGAAEAPGLTFPASTNQPTPVVDANAVLPERILQTVMAPLSPLSPLQPGQRSATGPETAGPSTVITAPGLTISLANDAKRGWSTPVLILVGITALSVAPAFLMMMTSFTRIIIVLGFLRRALGTQTLPPNQVMAGLALFLSLFIMTPTINRINDTALQPYLKETISQEVAFANTKDAVRDFMLKHTRKNDLALFIHLAKEKRPRTPSEVSFLTLVPAFMTSELKTSFQMGFIIFLPFLVIDLVVSAVLMALGMMMLPPVVVSLPFKILLFCLVDGWTLLMQALVASYR
jgi:flagellar biosynthetic protein FliP